MLEGSLQRPQCIEAIPWCTHHQSAASVVSSHQDDTGQVRVRGEHLSKALSDLSVKAGPLPPWGEHSAPQTSSRGLNSWTEQQRCELGSNTRALPRFQTVPHRSPVPGAHGSARRGRRGRRGPKAPQGCPGMTVSAAGLLRGRWIAPGLDRVGCGCWGSLGSLASHCSSYQAAVWPHTNPMR